MPHNAYLLRVANNEDEARDVLLDEGFRPLKLIHQEPAEDKEELPMFLFTAEFREDQFAESDDYLNDLFLMMVDENGEDWPNYPVKTV